MDNDIKIDTCSESNKENEIEIVNTTRQPNTTQNQFDKIVAFMECYNEEVTDKETFGKLWDNLAATLNNIGPPKHTVAEWKKIWSAHKYYSNRKRSISVVIEDSVDVVDEDCVEDVFVEDVVWIS